MYIKKIATTLSFLVTLLCLTAQSSIEVKENVRAMSLGERTGYTIILQNTDEKDAIKAFRSWAGDLQKKADVSESAKHEASITGFVNQELSETPTNVYFLFEEAKDELIVTGFFDMGGTFVSSATNQGKVQHCKQFMTRFAYRMEKLAIEEQLAAAEKELEKRTNEQEQLEKKQKQLNDDIAECEESIKNAKSDLEQNATEQKSKKEEIGKQGEQIKDIQKRLKGYEGY